MAESRREAAIQDFIIKINMRLHIYNIHIDISERRER